MPRSSEVGLIDLVTTGLGTEHLADLHQLKQINADSFSVNDAELSSGRTIIRPEDIWLLGEHRIICGDSTDPITVAKLLEGARPHLMVTDPPYGVEYNADWRNQQFATANASVGGRAVGRVSNDDVANWELAWKWFPGDVAYVWHADKYASSVQQSLELCDFEIRCQIIWAKNRFVVSRGHYHWQHEPMWYAVKKGCSGHWQESRDQTTLWNIMHTVSDTGHSTQKPVECMKRPIENNSQVGDSVYEPFSGSGTTIIAAEITKRKCYAVEIDPRYVYAAINRWQQFTGKQAVLQETGEIFSEVLIRRKNSHRHKLNHEKETSQGSQLNHEKETNQGDRWNHEKEMSQREGLNQALRTSHFKEQKHDEQTSAAEDPVLAELIYQWYAPQNGSICDPFNNLVRQNVAKRMGYKFTTDPLNADLLYFCPVLNDTGEALWYPTFLGKLLEQIKEFVRGLICDRFLVAVVDDARHKDGYYYGFPHHCAEAFIEAGVRIWDESVCLSHHSEEYEDRWQRLKQLRRQHSNILVFCKGNIEKAIENIR